MGHLGGDISFCKLPFPSPITLFLAIKPKDSPCITRKANNDWIRIMGRKILCQLQYYNIPEPLNNAIFYNKLRRFWQIKLILYMPDLHLNLQSTKQSKLLPSLPAIWTNILNTKSLFSAITSLNVAQSNIIFLPFSPTPLEFIPINVLDFCLYKFVKSCNSFDVYSIFSWILFCPWLIVNFWDLKLVIRLGAMWISEGRNWGLTVVPCMATYSGRSLVSSGKWKQISSDTERTDVSTSRKDWKNLEIHVS